MEAYSMDLRERVMAAVEQKEGTKVEIARRFGVTDRWIRKLLKQRRDTGSIAPKPHGGGQTAKFTGAKLERLRALVEADPDATLEEWQRRSRVACSRMAVWRALGRLGLSRKKRPSVPRNKIVPK